MQDAQANQRRLCGVVLAGNFDEARALALRFSRPKPKGSSILRAWFDGICLPNPSGHAGYGVVVKRRGQEIYSKAVYMGHGPHLTQEVAEYAGLISVLRFLQQEGIQWATVYGDSRMVIQQVSGEVNARRRKETLKCQPDSRPQKQVL
jgi:ribonuclease HI